MSRGWLGRVGAAAIIAVGFAAIAAVVSARPHVVWAAADEAYSVAGVAVDVTAADANQARDQALSEGQHIAWLRLMDRLVAPDQVQKFATLTDDRIALLVQSFEVASEKVAPDRYIATLTYHFNPDAVRAVLASAAVAYVEGARSPVLVLPVLEAGGGRLLFEEGNAWWSAWDAISALPGLVPIVMPLGDLEDLAIIDGARAVGFDGPAIARIAERYGASGAAIVVLTPDPSPPDGTKGFTVNLTILVGEQREVGSETFTAALATADGELYAAAARAVRARLDGSWKGENLVAGGAERQVRVEIPVAGLAEWVDVRRRLANLGAVRRVDVTTLGARLVSVTLTVVVDDTQLATALATQRLVLAPDADMLVLRLGETAATAP
ncbi:MAG: DUF2066 domain-containing protein [Alphaproteobacteria bacterium]|nr:DUF2066 domain-containing protein [Alphaproteobacteria bacterium]